MFFITKEIARPVAERRRASATVAVALSMVRVVEGVNFMRAIQTVRVVAGII